MSPLHTQKLSEFSIIEIVEKICDPDRPEGEWIAKQDIVEEGTKLKVSGRCAFEYAIRQDSARLTFTAAHIGWSFAHV